MRILKTISEKSFFRISEIRIHITFSAKKDDRFSHQTPRSSFSSLFLLYTSVYVYKIFPVFRFSLQPSVLMPFEVVFCFPDDDAAQCDQRDHIRDRHQAVEDIRDSPDGGNRHIRSDKDSCDVEPAIHEHTLLISVGKILQAAFSVVVPSENCRKREKYQTEHQQKRSDLFRERQPVLECESRNFNAFQPIHGPGSGEYNRNTCHQTDNNCINKRTCHGNQPLPHRFLRLCRCGGDRCGSETGFV